MDLCEIQIQIQRTSGGSSIPPLPEEGPRKLLALGDLSGRIAPLDELSWDPGVSPPAVVDIILFEQAMWVGSCIMVGALL